MDELPYIFDLMWDVKTIEQLAFKKRRLEEAEHDLKLLNETIDAVGLREEVSEAEALL